MPEPPASAAACAESRCGGSPSPLATGGSSAPRAAAWGGTRPPAPPTPPTRPSSRPRPPTRRPSPEPATQPGPPPGAPRRLGRAGIGRKGPVGIRALRLWGAGREMEANQALLGRCRAPGCFGGALYECSPNRGCSSSPQHPVHLLQQGKRWQLQGGCSSLVLHPGSPRCRTRAGSALSFLTLPCFPSCRDVSGSGLPASCVQEPRGPRSSHGEEQGRSARGDAGATGQPPARHRGSQGAWSPRPPGFGGFWCPNPSR